MCKFRLDAGQIEVLDEAMAEVYRSKTPAQRVAMIGQAYRTARLMLHAAVRRQRPDLDEAHVEREVSRRLLRAST